MNRKLTMAGITAALVVAMALPASTSADGADLRNGAAADVVKYQTIVTVKVAGRRNPDGRHLVFGEVMSEVRKCMVGRRVVVFNRQPGADRKLGADRSDDSPRAGWGMPINERAGRHLYAKVLREVHDAPDYICRSDLTNCETFTCSSVEGPGLLRRPHGHELARGLDRP